MIDRASMKTIAIDIRLLGKKRTGDEMVFRFLTKEVLAFDRENRYVLLTDVTEASARAILYQELGIVGRSHVEIRSLLGRNRFLWNLFSVPFFLFRHRVDVFHTQYILPIWVPARTRVVLHIHDVSFRALPEYIGWKDRWFLASLIPRSLRRANTIVTPSEFTKNEIAKYYPGVRKERIAVVPNACGDEFGTEASPEALIRARACYHLPQRYLIAVGTLQPRKNLPLLIRALAVVRERDPSLELVLVGNRSAHHFDPEIDRAITETGLEGMVHFPGFVATQDLPAIIRGALVYVFPSRYEGFGIPLLEAMSQGTPIAASSIACFREVAGEAAAYFDPAKIDACAEIMYTLSIDSEQRRRLIEAGKRRLGRFSWPQSAQLLLRIYE